jgi:tetratricopeptide (TPR) repeat protein
LSTDFLTQALAQKQYGEAVNYLIKARMDIPEPPGELLQKADDFLQAKQWMNAGDLYNSILSDEPQNQSAMLGLLYVAIEKKQELEKQKKPSLAECDQFLSLINKAIETTDNHNFKQLKADMGEYVYEYAKNLIQAQNLNPAGQWAETGLKFAPDHLPMKKLNYQIQAKISIAENRLTTPEPNNALSYYQQILSMDPDDPDAKKGMKLIIEKYKAMALSAQKDKKYKEAAGLIQKARTFDPENAELQTIEWMILGDTEASGQARAEMYLKALKADPANPLIKTKIEDEAKDIAAKGNANEATALLTKAQQINPEHSKFNELIQSIGLFQKEKDKITDSLNAIKNIQAVEDKIEAYKTLFSNLNFAIVKLGREKISPLKQDVIDQVKTDTQSLKIQNHIIPAEFMDLVTSRLPELNEYMINIQYDILIQNGDNAALKKEAADYFLEAFKLDKTKTDAKDKIVFAVMDLQKSGMQNEAHTILQQAASIAPDDLQLSELVGRNKPMIEFFATESGCGKENMIRKAPATIERLNLCIQYKNMEPDSIVKVVFQTIEIPIVLNGRSGAKPVSITAPLEGFSPGNYSIALKQKGTTISETFIEFVSKRR